MNDWAHRVMESKITNTNTAISFDELKEIMSIGQPFSCDVVPKQDDGYSLGYLMGSLIIVRESDIMIWNSCQYCHTKEKPRLYYGYISCPKCGAPL